MCRFENTEAQLDFVTHSKQPCGNSPEAKAQKSTLPHAPASY